MFDFINFIDLTTISLEEKIHTYEVNVGDKITTYDNLKEDCINLANELHKYGFVTRIGCNEAGDWSVYISDRLEDRKGYELSNYIKRYR